MPITSIAVAWAMTVALTTGAVLSLWFAVRGARTHRMTHLMSGLLGTAASIGAWLYLWAPQHVTFGSGTAQCIVEPLQGFLVDDMNSDACVAKNRVALTIAALVALVVIAVFTSWLLATRRRAEHAESQS